MSPKFLYQDGDLVALLTTRGEVVVIDLTQCTCSKMVITDEPRKPWPKLKPGRTLEEH